MVQMQAYLAVVKIGACSHDYHKSCLGEWLSTQVSRSASEDRVGTCPMCRHLLVEAQPTPRRTGRVLGPFTPTWLKELDDRIAELSQQLAVQPDVNSSPKVLSEDQRELAKRLALERDRVVIARDVVLDRRAAARFELIGRHYGRGELASSSLVDLEVASRDFRSGALQPTISGSNFDGTFD